MSEGKVNEWWLVLNKNGEAREHFDSEGHAKNHVAYRNMEFPALAPHSVVKVITVDTVLEMIDKRISCYEMHLMTEDPCCKITKGELAALQDLKEELAGKK